MATPRRGVAFTQPGGKISKDRTPTGVPDVNQASVVAALSAKGQEGGAKIDPTRQTMKTKDGLGVEPGTGLAGLTDPNIVKPAVSKLQSEILANRANKGAPTGKDTIQTSSTTVGPGGITDRDLFDQNENTLGFNPESAALIKEQNRLDAEKAARDKAESEFTSRGITGDTTSSVEGLTDLPTGGVSGQVLEESTDIIEKTAEIQKDQLDQNLYQTKKNLTWEDGMPQGLTDATAAQVERPYSRVIDLLEQQQQNQIAQKEFERNRYENEMGRNISVAENEAIEEELRLRSMAAVNGWSYNSGTFAQTRNQIQKTSDALNFMKTDKAQTSQFMGQQIGFIQKEYDTKIANQVEDMEQAKMTKYDETVQKINDINGDILLNDLEKRDKILTAQQSYVENYYDEMQRTQEIIDAASKKAEEDSNWVMNHDEIEIDDGKNYTVDTDGNATFYWRNKQTGDVETTTGKLPGVASADDVAAGITPAIQSAINVAADLDDLKKSLDIGDFTSEERQVALSAWARRSGSVFDQAAAISEGTGVSEQELLLTQYKTGNMTNTDVSAMREKANKEGWGDALIDVLEDPQYKPLTEKTASKFVVPEGINQFALDKIVEWRQANGMGNRQFQGLEEKGRGQVQDAILMGEKIDDMKRIYAEFRAEGGNLKQANEKLTRTLSRGAEFVGFEPSKELTLFRELQGRSGELLALFVKDISGAAVSEQEFQRLSQLKPNVKLSDTQFESLLGQMEKDYNSGITKMASRFAITDGLVDPKDAFNALSTSISTPRTIDSANQALTEARKMEMWEQQQDFNKAPKGGAEQIPEISIPQTKLKDEFGNNTSFNENPSGLKYTPTRANDLKAIGLIEGKDFAKGTDNPDWTRGTYVAFKDVPTALGAYDGIWRKNLGGMTIQNALINWVGTPEGVSYANSVLAKHRENGFGEIDLSRQVNSLSTDEMQKLLLAQMNKENPRVFNAYKKQYLS